MARTYYETAFRYEGKHDEGKTLRWDSRGVLVRNSDIAVFLGFSVPPAAVRLPEPLSAAPRGFRFPRFFLGARAVYPLPLYASAGDERRRNRGVFGHVV